jgi:hypothetical protein
LTSATSATSEGAQGIFSKITFLKSVHQAEKNELQLSFVVKIFTKSIHRGGVIPNVSFLSVMFSTELKKRSEDEKDLVKTEQSKIHA